MKPVKALRTATLSLLLALPAAFAGAQSEVTLVHVHGLSYSPDGKRLFIPSHFGLAIYSEGRWRKAPGPEHDYMGFSAARNAFYSSGHPAPGSTLPNPFGLMKSSDGGKTWKNLGLLGEADFHVLAASYGTSSVYVHAATANSRMPQPGIYHTADDGKTWKRARGEGLSGRLAALAVHPSQGKTVAAATETGLFLSGDQGETFVPLAAGGQATSVHFDLDGTRLWLAGHAGKATLRRISLKSRQEETVGIPDMTQDAVAYIAQNPAKRDEYAIATFTRNVHVTSDGGKTWNQIAEQGRTR
jgi:hypothetical protein